MKYRIEAPGQPTATGDYCDEMEARAVVRESGLVADMSTVKVTPLPDGEPDEEEPAPPPRERKVLATAEVLADLAQWWESRPPASPDSFDYLMDPGRYLEDMRAGVSRGARRIAGSKWDQEIPAGTQNPYWEIIRQLPLDPILSPWQRGPEPMLHWMGNWRGDCKFFADRFDMCGTYSWAICSPGDITWLKTVLGGQGVVEPGAGTGYWAWQMEQAGIDTAAYELEEQGPGNHFARRTWTNLLRDDHSAPGHHPDRALFLSWPSYAEPWAAQSLACYGGDLLIYCGEGEGGCTADDTFFELRDAEWEQISDCPAHVSFWGIHDYLAAYRRKP